MAETNIEWAHYTFNPWRGCTKISDGCKNCYAEKMSGRNHKVLGVWGKNGTRPIAAESYWKQLLKWNRDAEIAGERRRVFCGSLMDIFEGNDTMPLSAQKGVRQARKRLFHLIWYTPHLDWLLLTKRPELVNEIMFGAIGTSKGVEAFPNVWLGTSVENKDQLERIWHLSRNPAAVHFVSIEPLLGDLGRIRGYLDQLNNPLVIVGGESGPNARPMHPDWVRSIRDQCVAAGVPFFFKQWGEYLFANEYVRKHQGKEFCRVGKKRAGRILDGREWNEFPEVSI